eukprot:COSAG05_NODE_19219_length_296_cov_0.720812_1_plen_47_part_10
MQVGDHPSGAQSSVFPCYAIDFTRAGSIYTDGEPVEGQNFLFFNIER